MNQKVVSSSILFDKHEDRNSTIVHKVAAGQVGLRLYRFSQLNFPNRLPSKRRCLQAIRAGELRVNGTIAEETRILCEGDVVELNEDVQLRAKRELERLGIIISHTTTPEPSGIADDLLSNNSWSFSVVWKPAGVASQELELADTKARKWTENTDCDTRAVYWLEKSACGWVSGYWQQVY
jgi:hypothetical protein